MLAMLRLRRSKIGEAAAAIESALARFRTDPWSMTRYHGPCRPASREILATREPSLARRMFAALEQPFAVLASEEDAAHHPSGNDAAAGFSRAVRSGRRRAGTACAVDGKLSAPPPRLLSGGRPPAARQPRNGDLNEFLGNSSQPLVGP